MWVKISLDKKELGMDRGAGLGGMLIRTTPRFWLMEDLRSLFEAKGTVLPVPIYFGSDVLANWWRELVKALNRGMKYQWIDSSDNLKISEFIDLLSLVIY